jgi:hypothetical protein
MVGSQVQVANGQATTDKAGATGQRAIKKQL